MICIVEKNSKQINSDNDSRTTAVTQQHTFA